MFEPFILQSLWFIIGFMLGVKASKAMYEKQLQEKQAILGRWKARFYDLAQKQGHTVEADFHEPPHEIEYKAKEE
jgi:hypothetical protein